MGRGSSHWPHKEEKRFREEPRVREAAPKFLLIVRFSISGLIEIKELRDESRKMNRNNCFCEANGNHVQIQEKKNETGKGGSHFLRKSCSILVIFC